MCSKVLLAHNGEHGLKARATQLNQIEFMTKWLVESMFKILNCCKTKSILSEVGIFRPCEIAVFKWKIHRTLNVNMTTILKLLTGCFILFSLNCSIIISSHIKLPPYSVVLTFDDGPNSINGITDSLLSVLRKHQVKAHFCLIGENVEQSPEIAKRIFTDGHDIVNHGFDDKTTLFKSDKKMQEDMEKWVQCIDRAIETSSFSYMYFRPAYGIYKPSLNKLLFDKQLQILPISFYAFDAQCKPNEKFKVLETTLKNLRKHKGGVIVLHDGRDSYTKLRKELDKNPDCSYNRGWVPEITDSLITILKREHYQFILWNKK